MNGCDNITFLGLDDDEADLDNQVTSFSEQDVIDRLEYTGRDFDLCLSHDEGGEYGHPHHGVVGRAARRFFQNQSVDQYVFAHYLDRFDFAIEVENFVKDVHRCFPSQKRAVSGRELDAPGSCPVPRVVEAAKGL